MENSLQTFNNGQFSVRSVCENGEIWFVARDIATALEYPENSINQVNNLCANVPEIWKGHKRIMTVNRGEQEMLCLTEQGVYFFLGRSDKPKAQPYQIWIAGEVVPSIRKTGSYSINQKAHDTFAVDAAVRIFELAGITGNQLILAADKVYKRCTGFSALLAGDIQLEAPVKEQALTPTEIAEALGIGKGRKGGRRVNEILCYAKFQRKIGKNWEPLPDGRDYAVVLDTNKKRSDGTPVRQIKWNSSVIPVIEQFLPVRTQ